LQTSRSNALTASLEFEVVSRAAPQLHDSVDQIENVAVELDRRLRGTWTHRHVISAQIQIRPCDHKLQQESAPPGRLGKRRLR
jgi:hypothetical protein